MEEVIGNQLETVKNAEPSMKGNEGKGIGDGKSREVKHSYSFISTTVDKTQLCHRAKIKSEGDRTENKAVQGVSLRATMQ